LLLVAATVELGSFAVITVGISAMVSTSVLAFAAAAMVGVLSLTAPASAECEEGKWSECRQDLIKAIFNSSTTPSRKVRTEQACTSPFIFLRLTLANAHTTD
jgi:hypothetical protein